MQHEAYVSRAATVFNDLGKSFDTELQRSTLYGFCGALALPAEVVIQATGNALTKVSL